MANDDNNTSADDVLPDEDGADRLFGDLSGDTLVGGGDKDMLRDGLGIDRLTGGSSVDRFDFDTAAECGNAGDYDVTTDFLGSQADKSLTTVDAKSTVWGDHAFTFIRTKALTGVPRGNYVAQTVSSKINELNTMQSNDFLL